MQNPSYKQYKNSKFKYTTKTPKHTPTHTLQNKLKQPQYKTHTKWNGHNTKKYPQYATLMCTVRTSLYLTSLHFTLLHINHVTSLHITTLHIIPLIYTQFLV
jgi:hypothetical protein